MYEGSLYMCVIDSYINMYESKSIQWYISLLYVSMLYMYMCTVFAVAGMCCCCWHVCDVLIALYIVMCISIIYGYMQINVMHIIVLVCYCIYCIVSMLFIVSIVLLCIYLLVVWCMYLSTCNLNTLQPIAL